MHGKLAKGINSTFIVLIPKVDNLKCFAYYWLISLVNRVYKIL